MCRRELEFDTVAHGILHMDRVLNKQIGRHMESESVCLPHCEPVDQRGMLWNRVFFGIGVMAEMFFQVQVIGDHVQGLPH
jgi:hypothetical protein